MIIIIKIMMTRKTVVMTMKMEKPNNSIVEEEKHIF